MIANVLENALKRLRFPQAAQRADNLLEQGGAVFKDAMGKVDDVAKQVISDDYGVWDGVESVGSWVKKGGQKATRVVDEFQSPDMVLGRTEPGAAIFNTAADLPLQKARFYSEHVEPFNAIIKDLTNDGRQKVFKALEDPTLVSGLDKTERMTQDFLKGKYDYFRSFYINHLAEGDPATVKKIFDMASRYKELDPAELKDLPDKVLQGIDFARRSIKDYAPHFFEKDDVVTHLQTQLDKFTLKAQNTQIPSEVKRWEAKAKEYQDSLNKIVGGGEPLSWEGLPKEFLFRNALMRKGKEGYIEDAVKSYNSYIYGLSKKVFDEPAVQLMAEHFKQLPFEMRPYAKRYIRDVAGYTQKSPLDEAAGVITNLQYWRTLGLNMRSALVNLTQQANTIVDAGPLWSIKGYIRSFTPEGRELYRSTGLPIEVPQAFTQDLAPSAGWMEKVSRVMGSLFRLAENTNRQHAFLTYLSRAEGKYGETTKEAIQEAIEGVHKTQFLYGKANMPMILRNPVGRVAGQYTSFTIKQVEFMRKLARENPLKFAVALGVQLEGAKTVGDVLGFDLSNSLGFGLTAGEAMDVMRSLSDGELNEGLALARGYMSKGTGLLPSGPAPTISMLGNIGQAAVSGDFLSKVGEEITPVAWSRAEDALRNISDKIETGQATISRRSGPALMRTKDEELYSTGIAKTAIEAVGPKMSERVQHQQEWRKQQIGDQLESKRKRIIADAILNGDQGKAEKLMQKYGVAPTREMLQEALLRRSLPRDQRKKYQVAEIKQVQREEQRLSRLEED